MWRSHARNFRNTRIQQRRGYVLLFALAGYAAVALALGDDSGNDSPPVRGADRPRVAIIGFESAPQTDERDQWVATAAECALERSLNRGGAVVVIPTDRLYQARLEVTESIDPPPPWRNIAVMCGAQRVVSSVVAVTPQSYGLTLSVASVDGENQAIEKRVEARTFFEMLEGANTELAAIFKSHGGSTTNPTAASSPARTPSALEYHARALLAYRAGNISDAAYYARQAIEYDALFRPAGLLLADIELRGAPDARSTGRMRLNRIADLARAADDPIDQIDAGLRQALICRTTGALDAASIRIESSLGIAYDVADPIRQQIAFGYFADLHIANSQIPGAAENDKLAEGELRRAAEWQTLAVNATRCLNDKIGRIPLLHRLAMLYDRLGDYDEAVRLLEECAAIGRDLKLPHSEATTLLLISQVQQHQKHWVDAERVARQALPLVSKDDSAAVHIAIAVSCRELARKDEALREFESALESLQRTDDLSDQLLCLREIAVLRNELGAKAGAVKALHDAIDLAHAMNSPIEAKLKAMLIEWGVETNKPTK